jgi:hypothetical protein
MRNFIRLGFIILVLSLTAAAADYPKGEFYGGYQYTHLEGGINGNGFDFAVTGNANKWFGVTGDIGSAYATVDGVSTSTYTYTFGPKFSFRSNERYTPFAHFLIGGFHSGAGYQGASASVNGFATLIGGGVDFKIAPRIAVRMPQFDWFLAHADGSTSSKNVRLSFGVVVGF